MKNKITSIWSRPKKGVRAGNSPVWEGEEALEFAREHDWGEDAELEEGKITNLKERFSKDGEYHEKTVKRAANIKALRKFGGY